MYNEKVYNFIDRATANVRIHIISLDGEILATVVTRYTDSSVNGCNCKTAIKAHNDLFIEGIARCSGYGYDMETSNVERLLGINSNGYSWQDTLRKIGYNVRMIV